MVVSSSNGVQDSHRKEICVEFLVPSAALASPVPGSLLSSVYVCAYIYIYIYITHTYVYTHVARRLGFQLLSSTSPDSKLPLQKDMDHCTGKPPASLCAPSPIQSSGTGHTARASCSMSALLIMEDQLRLEHSEATRRARRPDEAKACPAVVLE